MSGEVDFIYTGTVQAMPMIRSKRARALAVTSLAPSSALPSVPTMASVYPGFVSANWYAMFAPAGTPAAIVNRLNSEILSALKSQDIRDFITTEGAEPVGSSSQAFAAHLRSEIERYAKVVKAANLKAE
jgi:tripartite-type tricarboxylate transporter receptor subunit TctC